MLKELVRKIVTIYLRSIIQNVLAFFPDLCTELQYKLEIEVVISTELQGQILKALCISVAPQFTSFSSFYDNVTGHSHSHSSLSLESFCCIYYAVGMVETW